MSRPTKRARGRPQKSENTALITSLIGVQDAMSRRTYDKIAEIHRTHLRVEDVIRANARIARVVNARLLAFPDRVVEHLTQLSDPSVLKEFLSAEIRRALLDLVEELRAMPPREPNACGHDEELAWADQQPPKPTRSRTLAEARSQAARLKTHLIDLKSRIVRS